MQGGLVGERTSEGGGAVALVGERQAFQPIGPPLIQVP